MQDDPHRDRLFEAEDTPLQQHRGLLWLSHGVIGFVALVAILNPQSLERWAAANPPSWGVETIRLTVGIWTERMQLAGLDQPRLAVEQGWEAFKALDWDDLAPDEEAPEPSAQPPQP